MLANTSHTTISMDTVFADADSYTISGDANTNGVLNVDNTITFTPTTDWFGTEVVSITAHNSFGICEHQISINVRNVLTITEDFNHSGSLPASWTTQHNGSTSNNWQAVNESGDDYNMQVSNGIFQTASEFLISEVYDFSQMAEIELQFYNDIQTNTDCTALFQIQTNGVTWQTIHSFPAETSSNGIEVFDISSFADGEANVRFRWGFSTSDFDPNHWYIDDLSISGIYNDTTPPATITDLGITEVTESSISLSWSATSDDYFSHYKIFVSTDNIIDETDDVWDFNDDSSLLDINTTSTTITDLTINTTYWLAIIGVDAYDNSAELSNIVTTVCTTPPTMNTPVPAQTDYPIFGSQTVTIGVTIQDDGLVDASSIQYRFDADGNGAYDGAEVWTAVTQNRVATLRASNKINSLRNSSRYDNASEIIVSESVTFTGSGNNLKFEFRAKDTIGNEYSYSGNSGSEGIDDDYFVAIDITAPTDITDLSLSSSTSSSVTLAWSPVTESNFSHYEIYYGTHQNISETDSVWNHTNDANLSDINTTSTTVTGLVENSNYWFKIVGIDAVGLSSNLSNEICSILHSELPECDSPFPTTTDYLSSQTVTIGCTFHDYYGIDESTIQYRIDANGNGNYDAEETWTDYTPVRSKVTRQNRHETYYQHYEVRADVSYTVDGDDLKYEFRASDVDGFGPVYSGSSNLEGISDDWGVYIDSTPPTDISTIAVTQSTGSSITVGFLVSSDLHFSHYELYYSTEAGVTIEDSLWSSADDPQLGAVGTSFILTEVTGLASSTTYYFKVRAVDLASNSSALSSEVSGATISNFDPQAPQNVTITQSGADMIINWDEVTQDEDGNAITVSGYNIYFSENPEFEADEYTLLGNVSENTFTHSGICNTSISALFYKVTAIQDVQVLNTEFDLLKSKFK